MVTYLNIALGAAVFVVLLVLVDMIRARSRRMSLNGKVAVITGGSSGIGLAAAKDIVRQGGRVVLLARRQEVLDEAADNVRAAVAGASVSVKSVDVTDAAAVARVFEEIIKEEDQIDVLICSAGMSVCRKLEDATPDRIDRMMRVNVNGCLNCAYAVVGHMKRRRTGRMCFVSSAAGQVGIYGYVGYSASKFALRGMAEALQMEVAPYNIAVSLAFPPDTDTPMLKRENEGKPKETKEIAGTMTLQQPEEVSATMVRGIQNGKFFINFDFLGNLLGWLTCGFAPITGITNNLLAFIFMPIGRLVAVLLLWQWNGICASSAGKKKDD